MIQIRHVPEGVHRTLVARAAKAGMSLSDYLLGQIREIAELPTPEEMMERLARLEPVRGDFSATAIIREERDRR